MEPAFSFGAPAFPPALLAGLPPEPDDPRLDIAGGALVAEAADHHGTIDPAKADLAVAPPAPLHAPHARRTGGRTTVLAVSVFLHAAAALAFLIAGPDLVQIEGSQDAGLLMLGNADQDQAATGAFADAAQVTLVTMQVPRPVETVAAEAAETIAAEAVEPDRADAVTPVEETQRAQTASEPAAEAAPDRTEPVDEAQPPQAAADPAPAILTAETLVPEQDAPAAVLAPEAAAAAPAEEAVTVAAAQAVEPEPEPPAKAVEKPGPEKQKAEKPKPEKPKPEKPKKAEKAEKQKKAAKAEKANRGSGGSAEADARRGVAAGDARGTKTEAGRSGALSAAGNAAVSNYPGKVAAKLRRAARGISGASRAARGAVARVRFTVSASGAVSGVGLAGSSGSPELDRAALAVVHRAAPFPPIPPEAGKRSWAFTLPLGLN